MIRKARKKPVEIKYMQYTGDNKKEICDWSDGYVDYRKFNDELLIETLEGLMTVKIGDFVIKGVEGEFYPIKPDIFEKTYEVID
ncbi:hypothetical protein [Staphylococcus aureus]|uniref:hypothetical protein n=1 Tax=Staphylococcus aureus TaxID=1280 RepID=UPI001C27E88D|nr:hypothetical protein [Staphylococcus aureus]HDE0361002.1 hypothetical protein [Staphylococcus aureus]HDE0470758.1 hypothetical protein [Staphylococcus aureus]HDE0532614.1 hypothetical protein [Staphylococcus aureus]HDE0566068.1 hypothetical protein [Staphylococcus aureus]HDE0704981.1 hypothetical protein [Staphylococcus aureus]